MYESTRLISTARSARSKRTQQRISADLITHGLRARGAELLAQESQPVRRLASEGLHADIHKPSLSCFHARSHSHANGLLAHQIGRPLCRRPCDGPLPKRAAV